MPLFENLFPYTNLHNLNLDWIIEMIEGIDPETVQALQELTPEFIAQINNKVNEAQIAATSAQTSASEANAAKDNAAARAAESAQKASEASASAATANNEAVRSENAANNAESSAETAVANALSVVTYGITPSSYATIGDSQILKSGKTYTFYLACTITGKDVSGKTDIGTVNYFPGISESRRFTGWFWRSGSPRAVGTATLSTNGVLSVNNANFEIGDILYIDTAFMA